MAGAAGWAFARDADVGVYTGAAAIATEFLVPRSFLRWREDAFFASDR